MRVLIVEDSALIAFMLADELAAAGYDVIGPAPNTQKAFQSAMKDLPHFALVDIDLEERDAAINLARRLADEVGTKVIFTTGRPKLRADLARTLSVSCQSCDPRVVVRCLSAASAVVAESLTWNGCMPSELELLPPENVDGNFVGKVDAARTLSRSHLLKGKSDHGAMHIYVHDPLKQRAISSTPIRSFAFISFHTSRICSGT
jgi:CheY-like chemotaxis protein